MAVTYAWRLDANSYAYILDPDNENTHLITNTPLVGDKLQVLAEKANEKYGEEAENGLKNYIKDFGILKTEIEKIYPGIDLLSADVYYNVDSTVCANLKGVGIKGIKFIGHFKSEGEGVNEDFVIETGVKRAQAGYVDVYGIYMDDQITNNEWNDVTGITPENMFFVYNGAMGKVGDAGKDADVDDLNAKILALEAKITALENELKNTVKSADINAIVTEILQNSDKSGLATQTSIDSLKREIDSLGVQVQVNTENIERLGGGGGTPGIVPTGGNVIMDTMKEDEVYKILAYQDNSDILFKTDIRVSRNNNTTQMSSSGTITAPHFYKQTQKLTLQ